MKFFFHDCKFYTWCSASAYNIFWNKDESHHYIHLDLQIWNCLLIIVGGHWKLVFRVA